MKVKNATVHGFRSAFRDWAAERTNFTNEVCEAALAHVIENKVEAAYRRGDLFDERRKLMGAWAAFGDQHAFAFKHHLNSLRASSPLFWLLLGEDRVNLRRASASTLTAWSGVPTWPTWCVACVSWRMFS